MPPTDNTGIKICMCDAPGRSVRAAGAPGLAYRPQLNFKPFQAPQLSESGRKQLHRPTTDAVPQQDHLLELCHHRQGISKPGDTCIPYPALRNFTKIELRCEVTAQDLRTPFCHKNTAPFVTPPRLPSLTLSLSPCVVGQANCAC